MKDTSLYETRFVSSDGSEDDVVHIGGFSCGLRPGLRRMAKLLDSPFGVTFLDGMVVEMSRRDDSKRGVEKANADLAMGW